MNGISQRIHQRFDLFGIYLFLARLFLVIISLVELCTQHTRHSHTPVHSLGFPLAQLPRCAWPCSTCMQDPLQHAPVTLSAEAPES